MNIRTVFSLGAAALLLKKYCLKVDDILSRIMRRSFISGFMFGLSYFLQFSILGLLLYLGAVYISKFSVDFRDSLATSFLLAFATFSAGNSIHYVGDISNVKTAAKNLFQII